MTNYSWLPDWLLRNQQETFLLHRQVYDMPHLYSWHVPSIFMLSTVVNLVNVCGPGYRWSAWWWSLVYMLFECRLPPPPMSTLHPPDIIHVRDVPRPSLFHALPSPCIILNANQRTKNGVGLGTRLCYCYGSAYKCWEENLDCFLTNQLILVEGLQPNHKQILNCS